MKQRRNRGDKPEMSPRILKGQVLALFAFDIGFHISLNELDALPATSTLQPLTRRKPTPSYLQYSAPPRLLALGETEGLLSAPGRIQATIFDFGAISISYRWRLSGEDNLDWSALPELSYDLYRCSIELDARRQARQLIEQIRDAIVRPELSDLVEDYFLFICEEMKPTVRMEEFFRENRSDLAQILRFEKQPLSIEQQSEAVSHRLSYYEHDLVVVDWNSAIICDRDYDDAASVLELINVELLEARYIDAQLDRRVREFQTLVPRRARWFLPLINPYRPVIEELVQLRLESLMLSERVDNALKLIGDLYLARVHAAASARLYLPTWQAAIAGKLEIVEDLYQVLIDRVRTAQSHALELVVIALILVEIIMAFFH